MSHASHMFIFIFTLSTCTLPSLHVLCMPNLMLVYFLIVYTCYKCFICYHKLLLYKLYLMYFILRSLPPSLLYRQRELEDENYMQERDHIRQKSTER